MIGAAGGVHSSQNIDPSKLGSSQPIQGQIGSRGAEGVLITKSASSAAADAAEEMSMVANQFKKNLDKRKLISGSGLSVTILERIQKIRTIQGAQAVKDLLNKFQSQENLTDQQIRERLESFSDDPVDQYVALDIVAEYFEELGDKDKADQLRSLRDGIKTNHAL